MALREALLTASFAFSRSNVGAAPLAIVRQGFGLRVEPDDGQRFSFPPPRSDGIDYDDISRRVARGLSVQNAHAIEIIAIAFVRRVCSPPVQVESYGTTSAAHVGVAASKASARVR
jgi:hypothetical protein